MKFTGTPTKTSAKAAVEALELGDYDRLFAKQAIYSGRREHSAATAAQPLYRRVLGEAFDRLPELIRRARRAGRRHPGGRRATVEWGRGVLARLGAAVVGFAKAGEDLPVTVAFEPIEGGERWRRTSPAARSKACRPKAPAAGPA